MATGADDKRGFRQVFETGADNNSAFQIWRPKAGQTRLPTVKQVTQWKTKQLLGLPAERRARRGCV